MDAGERNEWRQADQLFTDLLELDAGARSQALDELDLKPSLHAKLAALIVNTRRKHTLLDAEQPDLLLWQTSGLEQQNMEGARDDHTVHPDPLIGRCMGDWRLIGLLGHGGMAAVYRAQRTGQDYQHEAAVKLLGLTLRGTADQRRFRRERQILASLQHPHIASLIDGGVADDGTPYLVMGLVHGQRIDEYCDTHGLSLRDRVELMLQVCSAVAFAHHKLVVHRDIKPGNILVDDSGHATLLDFGIAHLLDDEDTGSRTLTKAFTPDYAAPEQRRGEHDVGTAVDTYGLGAVLHRLATGAPPKQQANGQPLVPSRVAASNGRHHDARTLRGDLDAIVVRALDPDPGERYAGAEALAVDLEGWLDDRPVAARRAGAFKRFGKLVRRNRVASGAVALALVALIAGIATILASRNTLEQRAEVLQAMVEFQSGMLQGVDPQRVGQDLRRSMTAALGKDVELGPEQRDDVLARIDFTGTAAKMIDQAILTRAVAESRKRFADRPEVRAKLLQSLGSSYRDLFLFDKAEPLLVEAMDLFRETLGPGDRLTLASMREYATFFVYVDRDEAASKFTDRMLALHQEYLDENDPETALAMTLGFMSTRISDFASAEAQLRTALPIVEARYGHDSSETSTVLGTLGSVMMQQGHFEDAKKMYENALAVSSRVYGPESGAAIDIRATLVWLNNPHSPSAQAHETYMELLRISTREFGEYHPRTLHLLGKAAVWPRNQGNYAAAESMQRKSYEGIRRSMGANHFETFTSQINLAEICMHLGKLEEAKALLMDALPRVEASKWRFFAARIEFIMGLVSSQSGDFQQAGSWLQKSWDSAVAAGYAGRQHESPKALVDLYAKLENTEKRAYWQAELDKLDTAAATTH